MRKIITIFSFLLIAFIGTAQRFHVLYEGDGFETQNIMFNDFKEVERFDSKPLELNLKPSRSNYGSADNSMLGPGLILGGLGFLAAGILTGSNRVSGTNQSGYYDLNRYLAIGTGAVLLPTGLIITIATK